MHKREWERYTTLQVGEKEIVDVVQVEKSRRERESGLPRGEMKMKTKVDLAVLKNQYQFTRW